MSSAPRFKEHEFALKVRCALDESIAHLPSSTINRLAAARYTALERKRPEVQPVFAWAYTSPAPTSRRIAKTEHTTFTQRCLRTWPLVVLLLGVISIAHWESLQHTTELADIDAAMISDELPLGAYLDHGFYAYLVHTR